MSNAIESGARQAVINCVRVQPGEPVVIITDQETRYLARAIESQVKSVEAMPSLYVMEDYGPRDDFEPLPFPAVLHEALADAKASFYIAQCKAGELHSFRMPMIDVVQTYGVRHAHMPGFTEIMMSQGMAADYEAIGRLCRQVHDCVSGAETIEVTTPAGTDIRARFAPSYKWIISDGRVTETLWKNLPDGEVFTAPATADGMVVVDGCLGDHFCETYGLLAETPVQYELANGRCVKGSVQCDNERLKQDFIDYTFETDAQSNRLGEFAIGTNTGLTELIGNLLQDEKFPGIHLALGNPYPDKTGAPWQSKAHCDGVLIKPTIVVDGQTIMKDGVFSL